MITLTGNSLALISAAFARVEKNESHIFPKNDPDLKKITEAIGADSFSVYDLGTYKNKVRYLRFDFAKGQIEFMICPQPEPKTEDPRPEGDGPPPGSPVQIAMAA